MTAVVITLDDARTSFLPGQIISGQVGWSVPDVPRSVEVQLVWKTRGRGDTDTGHAPKIQLPTGRTQGQEPFQFEAPEGPYSFSGKLVSLVWSVEATIDPGSHTAVREIVISPTGAEIDLYAVAPDTDRT